MSKLLYHVAFLAFALVSGHVHGARLPTHQLSQRQSTEGGYGGTDVTAFCQLKVIANKGQAYQHRQVTDSLQCNEDTCSADKLEEHTFGIDASIDVSDEEIGGLSAGVVNEWTSGDEYDCQGVPGQTVCVWVKTAYTVYEVGYDNIAYGSGGCGPDSEVKFPNAHNNGGGYLCKNGTDCQFSGATFWE